MQHREWSEDQLLPFDVIEAATQGDSEALAKVMKHFENDIAKKSLRIFYDEFGQSHLHVDDELRQRIECKLMAQIIMKFRIR